MMCAFTEWLHHWQELVGAIIGAIAVTSTVWWTLRAERRRRDQETHAMRVALGAEIRQFAANALSVYRDVVSQFLSEGNSNQRTYSDLQKIVRFPDPVIFPHSVPNLGSLGKYAYEVVYFFNQLSNVHDKVEHLWSDSALPADVVPPSRYQLLNAAEALLKATETAIKAYPAFSGTPRSEFDSEFEAAVLSERKRFDSMVR
jgi:hypothetical protein